MTRLTWGAAGSRIYEVGVDRGVFYPNGGIGVAWNGLIAVNEAPVEVDESSRYFDGVRYNSRSVFGGFSGNIEAYTYPEEFSEYDGYSNRRSRQPRKSFGLSYRTRIENENGTVGYKLHVVYNVLVTPSARDHSFGGSSLELTTFNWDFTTKPEVIPGVNPCAHLVIDSRIAHSWALEAAEAALYGDNGTDARLPDPAELLEIFESNALLRIIDYGDGTWSAIGPDEAIQMLNATTFEITWPSAVYIDSDTYTITSL